MSPRPNWRGWMALPLAAAFLGVCLLAESLIGAKQEAFQSRVVANGILAEGKLGSLLKDLGLVVAVPSSKQADPADEVEPRLFRDRGRRGRLRYEGVPGGPSQWPAATLVPETSIASDPLPILSLDLANAQPMVAAARLRVASNEAAGKEYPAALAWFESGRLSRVTGVGVRLHGSRWRAGAKLDFRLLFRDPYGVDRLPADSVFEDASPGDVRRLVLLSMEDRPFEPFAWKIAELAGVLHPPGRLVRLFTDGLNQGVYYLVEPVRRELLTRLHGEQPYQILDEDNVQERGILNYPAGYKDLELRVADTTRAMTAREVRHHADLQSLSRWAVYACLAGIVKHEEARAWRVRGEVPGPWAWMPWNPEAPFLAPPTDFSKPPWEEWKWKADLKCRLFHRLITDDPEFRRSFKELATGMLAEELRRENLVREFDLWVNGARAAGLRLRSQQVDETRLQIERCQIWFLVSVERL